MTKLKNVIILLSLIFFSCQVIAQSNQSKFILGLDFGNEYIFTESRGHKNSAIWGLSFQYNFQPQFALLANVTVGQRRYNFYEQRGGIYHPIFPFSAYETDVKESALSYKLSFKYYVFQYRVKFFVLGGIQFKMPYLASTSSKYFTSNQVETFRNEELEENLYSKLGGVGAIGFDHAVGKNLVLSTQLGINLLPPPYYFTNSVSYFLLDVDANNLFCQFNLGYSF